VGAAALAALAALAACGIDDETDDDDAAVGLAWTWDLPPGVPPPIIPDDNPMTPAKVDLGRHLFYDRRLSVSGDLACATCHRQELAFTDGLARARLGGGLELPRGAPSLGNVAYAAWLGWANPALVRLEAHAVVPLLGDDPPELGWQGRERELEARLAADPTYGRLFADAFPEDEVPVRVQNVVRALACFERTLMTFGSPFDRYLAGDRSALPPEAERGLALFRSERLACARCHAGWATTDAAIDAGPGDPTLTFHNTGLYDVGGTGAYPEGNTGLHAVTGRDEDMGKFRAPMLRNVAVTAPYMHDGSVATLDEVIDHYARGGRLVVDGPYAGDGRDNPHKSPLVHGFALTTGERADLLAFLQALTDEGFLVDRRFADPWAQTAAPAAE
jgi:cytochrome c peroxidase